ncbi:MAG: acetyl-CoA carboxylase biotin carboxyl carrier protein [Alphaproteobacteria bacterium]|jgi:acetyl-CoA carboxylase biotin carboxyl carrier protein|nr:acetyl-CoA carboxylase biotin carboxyl carrier protein [Alphaproteobacteria bacterium]
MTAKFKIDGDAIRQLAEILVDTKLTEIEYEDDGRRIRVSRGGGVQAATVYTDAPQPVAIPSHDAAAPAAPPPLASSIHPGTVKSPMVGTAYMCAEPGAAPFVKVGDMITVGQTLMIIEAMKVMNPIKAAQSGKLTQIFVKDGSPVEFGEPLMVVE